MMIFFKVGSEKKLVPQRASGSRHLDPTLGEMSVDYCQHITKVLFLMILLDHFYKSLKFEQR